MSLSFAGHFFDAGS